MMMDGANGAGCARSNCHKADAPLVSTPELAVQHWVRHKNGPRISGLNRFYILARMDGTPFRPRKKQSRDESSPQLMTCLVFATLYVGGKLTRSTEATNGLHDENTVTRWAVVSSVASAVFALLQNASMALVPINLWEWLNKLLPLPPGQG